MFYFACGLACVLKVTIPSFCSVSRIYHHAFLITHPIKQKYLHFTLSSSIIHHLWLSLVLLKVTISFVLFLPALSKFHSTSHHITRPSSCEYCHNFASPLPSPFLILFSLWLSLMLLKVIISSFRFASCVHRHACLCHAPSRHQHCPISPPFLFSPISLLAQHHSIPIWFDTFPPSLTLWLGPIHIKPPCRIVCFFVCSCIERTKRTNA